MAGATITVSLTGDDLSARFARLASLAADTTPTMKVIGAGIRDTTPARFDRAQDPEDRPWQGWSPAHAALTCFSGYFTNGCSPNCFTAGADPSQSTVDSRWRASHADALVGRDLAG